MRLANRLIQNTLFNFGASVWLILFSFLTIPYIISKLGVESYAIYSLLYSIIGYFSFLDLGLGKAIIKFVSELHVHRDHAAIQRVLGTAIVVFCITGLFGALVIAILNETVLLRLLKISPALRETARTAFYMGAIGFLVSMPTQVIGAIPRGLQRFDIANIVEVTIGSAQTLLTVLLLYLGFHLREVIFLDIVMSIISIATYLRISRHLLPEVSLLPRFDRATFKKIFGFSGYIALDSVLITFSARINSFILGSYRPVAAVAYYTVPDSLSSKVAFIPRSISQTIYPSFAEIQAKEDHAHLENLFLRATRYMVLLTLPFLFLFVILAEPFLLYWLGADFARNALVPLQLMGSCHILTFWAYSSMEGTRALNRPDYSTKTQVVISFLNIIICFILIPKWGLLGAVLAFTLPRYIIIPWFILLISRRLFVIPTRRLLSKSFKRSFIVGLPCAALCLVGSRFVHSLVQVIILFAGVSLVYLAVSYFFVLDAVDRGSFWQYIRLRIKR